MSLPTKQACAGIRTLSDRPIFLERDSEVQGGDEAPCAVLPIPYERTTSFGAGTAGAPAAILRASQELELFDEECRRPFAFRVQTLPPVACDSGADEQVLARIEASAGNVFGTGRFLLAYGGEHTVSVPLVRAASAVAPNLTVLHLDAHADLRESYGGSRLSHACPMRRIRERGLNTVHVGIRSISGPEYDYAQSNRIPIFWAHELAGRDWMDAVLDALGDPIYVSVDIDVLDPGLVPGTGTPEPGGLSWWQVCGLLKTVCDARTVIGCDIVEVIPVPGMVVSEVVAARLGVKMLNYIDVKKAGTRT